VEQLSAMSGTAVGRRSSDEARSVRGTGRRTRRAAASWADRTERRLPGPIRGLVSRIRGDDVLLFSAGLAFYALVSILPLTIMVMWVTGLILGDQRLHQLAAEAGRLAPGRLGGNRMVQRLAQIGTTAGIGAIVTGLWPATAYGSGLKRAFDRLMHGQDEPAKGLRGRGLALLVLLPLFTVGTLGGALAGSKALGSGTAGVVAGACLALLVGFAAALGALVLIYWIFPPKRLRWPSILRGAAFAAAGIAVLSLGFVLYLASGTDLAQHYASGALAMLVLLGLWLFCSNVMMLVGYKLALETN
jgi:membrane protein